MTGNRKNIVLVDLVVLYDLYKNSESISVIMFYIVQFAVF